jgi:hypothetical protein
MFQFFKMLAGCLPMAYEAEKDLLEKASTPAERAAAVEQVIAHGMPLSLIEEFLDWLDLRRSQEGSCKPA